MSSYRAGQSKSETRKSARDGLGLSTKLSLLAAGSLLPILLAPAANAQCAAVDGNNQSVALNALTSGSVVTCSGITDNENISVSPPVESVFVQFLGAPTVSDSNFTLNGDNHGISSGIGSTFDNVGFSVNGANGQIFLQGSGQGIAALATGADSLIVLEGGAWDAGIVRASGQNARIEVGTGATVSGSGIPIGLGVLSGGMDNNVFSVNGGLVARTDGLLITDDGGDDVYYIGDSAILSSLGGAQSRIADAAGNNDLLLISGTHSLNLDITGIESLIYSGTSAGPLSLNGIGNLLSLSVDTGEIGQIDIGSLMDANGFINIGADGSVRYGAGPFAGPFSQTLIGTGEMWLDGSPVQIAGDNSDFAGTFRVSSTVYVGSNQNAFGSSNIINQSGDIILQQVNLANQISGTGHVTMQGAGGNSLSTLSGVNTYSGGTLITNAGSGLLLTNASAAGTGTVTVDSNAFLELDFGTAGGDFMNLVTGAGSVRKVGAGTLTVSNTGSDYTGGTQIDAGVLRITDFAALGTGPIVANAGSGLMYDYSGAPSELFAAPLMTGDGQFIKAGSGTIVIDTANTWTGGAQILAGRVGLNDGQGLGTGNINIAQDAVLGIGGVTLANNVTGAGEIVKTANNTAILTGINTNTGGIRIEDGAIEVASGEALGGGVVDIFSGASLLVVDTTDTTVSQQLQGAGSFVKNGAGRAELTGNNGLSGVVAVNGGTLAVGSTSNVGSAGVQVASGATLEIARSIGNGSFSNDISGDGRLIKTGASRVTLDGINTYTGGTHIMAGSLRVPDISHLGSGSIVVDLNAALDLSITGDATFSHALSGAGMLRKSGAGNLLLLSNTLSGGLDIVDGNVAVNTIAALGAGPVATAQGASLTVDNATTEISSVLISGDGQLVKEGAGDLIIQNANTYTGGTDVSSGVLRVANTSAIGTGGLSIASGATFELANATNLTFANALSGAGTFRKTGTGDLTFSSAFSVGSLLIDTGRVRLNGTMTGNATVGAGGILNGVGQVTGTLTNNGTVAPGNSIGTLNVQGNYVHNANSVLEIEFDANGGIDLLNVSGTAQLNGGTLRFISLGGAEGTGGAFLVADGGVSGTFANIETVGAQLPLAVIYQPSAAVMAPSVLTARPSTFNSQALAASDTVMGFADSVSGQALRSSQGNGAWVEAFGASASRDAVGQTLAYQHDASGISLGVRGPLTDHIDAGVSLGWSRGDVSLGSDGGWGQQDGMLASLFGRYRLDSASIGAGVLYGSLNQSTVRNVSFNTFSDSIAGAMDSVVTGAFLSGDAKFAQAGGWTFGGGAQVSYLSQVQDAYTESGSSPLRLELPEMTFEAMGLQAGLDASTAFDLGGTAAWLQFDVGLRHASALDDRIIPVTFAASGASVDLQGDARDHTSPYAGASFEWALGGSTILTAGYQGRFGDDERHETRIGLQMAF